MPDIQWISRDLRIGVHNDTVDAFGRFNDEQRHQIYILSNDAARMYLFCLDILLKQGWEVVDLWNFKEGGQQCHIDIADLFSITLGDERSDFTLNYYGQMQLHLWLLEFFDV